MTFGADNPFGRPRGSGGSGEAGGGQRPGGDRPRRPSPLLPTNVVIGVLVAAFVFFANIYADVLWFNQLGYSSVFWTENLTKAAIFAVVRIAALNVVLFVLLHAVFTGSDHHHLALYALLTPLAAGVLLSTRPQPEPELAWVS